MGIKEIILFILAVGITDYCIFGFLEKEEIKTKEKHTLKRWLLIILMLFIAPLFWGSILLR